jgi:hypothetical protein
VKKSLAERLSAFRESIGAALLLVALDRGVGHQSEALRTLDSLGYLALIVSCEAS